jgi:hypothetical protein
VSVLRRLYRLLSPGADAKVFDTQCTHCSKTSACRTRTKSKTRLNWLATVGQEFSNWCIYRGHTQEELCLFKTSPDLARWFLKGMQSGIHHILITGAHPGHTPGLSHQCPHEPCCLAERGYFRLRFFQSSEVTVQVTQTHRPKFALQTHHNHPPPPDTMLTNVNPSLVGLSQLPGCQPNMCCVPS